jgi:membrane-associated phospholipid phosphatase
MRRRPIGLVLWLVALAGAETVCFVMLARFFVRSEHGQLLDTVALTGRRIGRAQVAGLLDLVLNTISVVSVAIATAVVGFVAMIRRRIALAFGVVLLIAGANATTEILKRTISRPNLGVDLQRAAAGNSLPSGHTTIAASVAVAVLLVLPARMRGGGAMLGALGATVVGVATLSAGWHRPSDAVAALLVVGAWAGVAGVFIVLAQRHHGNVDYGPASRLALPVLAIVGLVLLAGAAVTLKLTDQVLATPPEELSRHRLFIAYSGSAMGIAGTASLVLASVLATAHRVVPQVVFRGARQENAGVIEG